MYTFTWVYVCVCEYAKISVSMLLEKSEKHFLHCRRHINDYSVFRGKIYLSHSHSLTHPFKTRISTKRRERKRMLRLCCFCATRVNRWCQKPKKAMLLFVKSLVQLRSSIGKKKLCPDRTHSKNRIILFIIIIIAFYVWLIFRSSH